MKEALLNAFISHPLASAWIVLSAMLFMVAAGTEAPKRAEALSAFGGLIHASVAILAMVHVATDAGDDGQCTARNRRCRKSLVFNAGMAMAYAWLLPAVRDGWPT